jgi:hypothetical protein
MIAKKPAMIPEVRMTEAARKRSAKIRQNAKETAENNKVSTSPKIPSRIRIKSAASNGEKKSSNPVVSNLQPKKAKIDDTVKKSRSSIREPLKSTTSMMNRNTITHSPLKGVTKMSSITAAKLKEREEKQEMKDSKFPANLTFLEN